MRRLNQALCRHALNVHEEILVPLFCNEVKFSGSAACPWFQTSLPFRCVWLTQDVCQLKSRTEQNTIVFVKSSCRITPQPISCSCFHGSVGVFRLNKKHFLDLQSLQAALSGKRQRDTKNLLLKGNTVCLILVSLRCLDFRTRQKMITESCGLNE